MKGRVTGISSVQYMKRVSTDGSVSYCHQTWPGDKPIAKISSGSDKLGQQRRRQKENLSQTKFKFEWTKEGKPICY